MKNLLTAMLITTVLFGFVGMTQARDLPELVSVESLTEEHDLSRVVLKDWVISGREVRTRRLDGQYTELVLGSETGRHLLVVMNEELFGRIIDRCLIVQGRYHVAGRFGGFLMPSDFIVAELAVVDFEGAKTGCRFEGVGE